MPDCVADHMADERARVRCRCVLLQVAVVKEAGTAAQQVWFSTLQSVEQDTAAGAPLSPCVIVVGAVAGLPYRLAATAARCRLTRTDSGAVVT